ncbi:MAG: lactonase family protein [Lachnospiraceae bacterium]|nr:lactonase family protein [Lachnospiraceae bacterium]
MYAYIGCRTTKERKARGKGIRVYKVDGKNWDLIQLLEGQVNPSYLCLDDQEKHLYSIHGDFSEVSAYQIHENGTVEYLNTTGTHGTNPVHLSLDQSGKWLFVANLQTGSVSVIPVREDGSLGTIRDLKFISGNGGPGYISHPHQVNQDRTRQWLLVPSQGRLQGIGKITVFRINSERGTLEETSFVKARTGAEPRHCVLHPNNHFCYCVNEKDSTVTLYYFNPKEGTLEAKQIVTSLPEDYTGDGWASAIDISRDGKTLYVSNRKHDSITVYQLNQENGTMTMAQNQKTYGEQPRFITITPDGKELLAANELTDTITRFDILPDGTLSDHINSIDAESPVCVAFKTK